MSIIRTKRNHVAALDPLPSDVAVVSRIGTARVVQPIHEYEQAVREAVAIADHMQAHVDVVPVSASEMLELLGVSPESLLDDLSAAEREELRRACITACINAIRYSNDPEVVAEASEVLEMISFGSGRQEVH
ncbi:MAG: hypothetical protein P8Y63_01175 [Deltaproteobacteria bacterium]|jgi:hypothetical protein